MADLGMCALLCRALARLLKNVLGLAKKSCEFREKGLYLHNRSCKSLPNHEIMRQVLRYGALRSLHTNGEEIMLVLSLETKRK